MKIEINSAGTLFVDSEEKKINDITVDFLEQLIELALKNEVEFLIDSNTLPIAQFFSQLKEGTSDGSPLKTKLNEINEKTKEHKQEIETILSS